jgi:hypothetical protein
MKQSFIKNVYWSLILMSVCMTSLSFGQFYPDPTKWYRIVFLHSGQCIRPVNSATGNNIQLEQSVINANDQSQLWRFRSGSTTDYWYPINASGKGFEILGTATGSYVGTWDLHNGDNQQFRFDYSASRNYYYMVDLQSAKRGANLTLDVEGVSTSAGAKIHTWTKKTSAYENQVVQFVEVVPTTFIPDPAKWYRMVFLHSGKCIRPINGTTGNIFVEQSDFNTNDQSQVWKFQPGTKAGYWYPINTNRKVLDVSGTNTGSYVQTWDMGNGANQQFRFDGCPNSNYYYMADLRSANLGTNFVLDVEGVSTSAGAKIHTWTKKTSAYENQVVKFVEIGYYDKNWHIPLPKTDITYNVDLITRKPTMLSDAEILSSIDLAFAIWSSASNLSIKRVPLSSTADIRIVFDAVSIYGGQCGFIPTTMHLYLSRDGGLSQFQFTHNNLYELVAHEGGHALGFYDYQIQPAPQPNPWSTDRGFVPPPPRGWHIEKIYWDWRMRRFGSGFGDYTKPTNYTTYKDISLSIMDYNHDGAPKDIYLNVGMWGRTDKEWQPSYLCQYDIDKLQDLYGFPTYLPIISMQLGDYYAPTDAIYQTNAYGTTSWQDANDKCREFLKPTDVRNLEGLVPCAPTSGCVLMFRYSRKFTNTSGRYANDFCLSTQTSLAGWTREASLGYWKTALGTINMKIGTKTRSYPTVPIYQYTKTGVGHTFGPESWTDGWDGWKKETLGYIVPLSEITKP